MKQLAPTSRPLPLWLTPMLAAALLLAASLWAYHRWFWVDNIGTVVPGKLYRSAQPRDGAYAAVAHAGSRRLINLRLEAESPADMAAEKQRAEAMGIELLCLPIAAKVPSAEQVRRTLEAIDASRRPVWLHCEHGEDRTGIVIAAWRVSRQHWPVSKALAELRRYRARLKPDKLQAVGELLDSLAEPPGR